MKFDLPAEYDTLGEHKNYDPILIQQGYSPKASQMPKKLDLVVQIEHTDLFKDVTLDVFYMVYHTICILLTFRLADSKDNPFGSLCFLISEQLLPFRTNKMCAACNGFVNFSECCTQVRPVS